jgi:PPOX class probable F420-dependent enzyme
MSEHELSPTARRILRGANVAVLSTLLGDGAPQSTAVWVHEVNGLPIIATTKDTLKYRNLRADPRMALTVFLREDPYVELNLRGRITQFVDDTHNETIDMLSEKYYGVRPYPYLTEKQEWVKMVVDVDRQRTNKELPDE